MMLGSAGPLLRASAHGGLHAGRTAAAHAFAFGGSWHGAQSLAPGPSRSGFRFAQSSAWPSFIHDQSLLDKYSSAAVLPGGCGEYFALLKNPPKR